jgi:hypothetical protein
MSAAVAPLPARRNGLLMLALIVALLALPFVVASALYFGGWKPGRGVQHGRLLEPPAMLPADGLRTPAGAPLATAELYGKWLLVLSIDGPCAAACAERIDELRRIQVSLNKDMGRLRRLVLSPQPEEAALAAVRARQPDLLALQAPAGWLGDRTDAAYRLHIVDPQGRRVIEYPPEVGARELRADLERLLKFAWNG